ncbi:MAG: hypothetical protein P4L79_16425 [Legionella sp.]|uniref:hypothetical protein n=1 Tax=Legionella sp. TaxID=459 RepID=UPI002840AED9|nr:hypothetical protein [Legionella sp.]
MSEYQYYEFRTDGRVLDANDRKELKSLSSRAIVTSTQAIYTYSYGDFRYDCEEILADLCDAMLYVSNFGTRQLMFRLPLNLIEQSRIEPYCVPYVISYSIYEDSLILSLCINDENGDYGWIEGDGLLEDLIAIRSELLNGDFRALYLVWLAAAQFYQLEDDDIEPPIPLGLKNLTSPQKALISFFELMPGLAEIASELSPTEKLQASILEELIHKLPEEEKTGFLLSLLANEPDLKIKLQRRLQLFIVSQNQENSSPKRTVAQLLAAGELAEKLRQEKLKEKQRAARVKELKILAGKEPALWQDVHNLIQLKTKQGYDNATKLLIDLKELAVYLDQKELFASKIRTIHQDYSSAAFKRRLYDNELI